MVDERVGDHDDDVRCKSIDVGGGKGSDLESGDRIMYGSAEVHRQPIRRLRSEAWHPTLPDASSCYLHVSSRTPYQPRRLQHLFTHI